MRAKNMRILKRALVITVCLSSMAAFAQPECPGDIAASRAECIENLCPGDTVITEDQLQGVVKEVNLPDGLVVVRVGNEKLGYSITDVFRVCSGK